MSIGNRIIAAWVVFIFTMGTVIAQIPPPDVICVFNKSDGTDTIRWNLPAVNCGTINGIDLYQSSGPNGPFSLVTTVNNTATTEVVITNTTNATYYYYLEIDADCPGEMAIHSDTLSNQIPPGVQIKKVSVINGNAIVSWYNESDEIPKIAGYVIYRVGTGTVPIDTVYGDIDSLIDPDANPSMRSVTYFVQAIDGCGISGPIGSNPHSTIYLQDSVGRCTQSLYFNWNNYDAWSSGVEFYELYYSIDGGPYEVFDTIPTGTLNTVFPILQANSNYRIFIRAKKQGEDIYSHSNVIDINPNILQSVRVLSLWGVSVENNTLRINWNWNADAQFKSADLIRNPSGTRTALDLERYTDTPQSINVITLDSTYGADDRPIKYAIQTIDRCDSLRISDTVQTAYIAPLALDGFTNRINISYPVVGGFVEVTGCELLRLKNGNIDERINLPTMPASVEDDFDGTDESNRNLCYQMVCEAEAIMPDSSFEEFTIRSNLSCPVQEVRLQVPNAFRPEGINNFFKPLLLFDSSIEAYSMRIYNRWGEMVFETTNPELGWEGLSNGEAMEQGVYVYHILIEQTDGRQIERKGTVLLLR